MHWRAWYADGQIREGRTLLEWRKLPSAGCLIVKVWRADGRKYLCCGDDAILLDPSREPPVIGINLPTPELEATARRHADEGRLKFGTKVPDEQYERTYAEALAATRPEI